MKRNHLILGTINWNTFEFIKELLTVHIELDMESITPSIHKKIDAAIAKAINEYNDEFNGAWGDAEPVIDYMDLTFDFNGNEATYYIAALYHSARNDKHEDAVNIRIGLAEQDVTELKKRMLQAIIEKLF